jgi:hypothetical protein
MKDVSTRELLRTQTIRHAWCGCGWLWSGLSFSHHSGLSGSHFLSTDDTDIFACNLLGSGVRISVIHVSGRVPITEEVHDTTAERSHRHNYIA